MEIVYVCHSLNNKNVRDGELNILREYPDKLYFEFGENELNIKKRFYSDLETMEKDYKAIVDIKNSLEDLLKVPETEENVAENVAENDSTQNSVQNSTQESTQKNTQESVQKKESAKMFTKRKKRK